MIDKNTKKTEATKISYGFECVLLIMRMAKINVFNNMN
jgi:hypothetical protein